VVGILVVHNSPVSFYNISYVSHEEIVQNQTVFSGRKKMRLVALLLLFLQPISLICVTKGSMERDYQTNKSISNISTIPYDHFHFYRADNFYLGAKTPNQKNYALSRAYINTASDPSLVDFAGVAPEKVYVNPNLSQALPEEPAQNNPIYDADVKALTIMSRTPVLLLGTRNPLYTDTKTSGTNQNICLVTGSEATLVYTNIQKLNDAAGKETGGIVDVLASRSYIFAAVSQYAQSTFGGPNSGITIVRSDGRKLYPNNSADGAAGNKAKNFAEAGNNLTMSNQIAMHWDQSLNRLFVGLRVTRASGTDPAHGLLVGRIEAGTNGEPKIVFETALPATAMADDDGTQIVGFKGATNRTVAIHHINTMQTSTRKSYVIVNGNVYNGAVLQNEVFAIPIVHQRYSETPLADAEKDNVGRSTSKTSVNQDAVVSAEADVTLESDFAATVGGGAAPDAITHMFTIGDSVYICCTHATDKDKQGIFKSSALYQANGLIRDWTPWQRVMGAVDRVRGGSIDIPTGQFWYLTESASEWDTVKVTQWGTRDNSLFGQVESSISSAFPKTSGGVHQLFNFDEQTASFLTNEFSLMVATGYKKAMLIQTGENSGGVFAPSTGTISTATYTDDALKNIGPICCCAVSQSAVAANGWLFVGGYNGVAVLCKNDGTGWTNLSNVTTDLTSFSFKTLGSFKNVKKLVCDDTNLYIVTPTKVYLLAMNSGQFSDPANATSTTIATRSGTHSFLDLIVSQKLGLLAATNGLFRTINGGNIETGTNQWTEVTSKAGFSLGPVTHLQPMSEVKGSFNAGGNLYVTAANMASDLTTIFRFDIGDTSNITNSTVQPITEEKQEATDPDRYNYYTLGEIRSAFITDGTFGYHSLPKHFERNNPARKVNMAGLQLNTRFSDVVLPLALESDRYNVGIPVQNTASGAWIFPGDWGIRVNE
jgi:hypothetical protein